MGVLTIGKNNWCAPTIMLAGEVRIGGGTSGGLSSCVVGWLACTEVLVMPEEIKASITPISCKKNLSYKSTRSYQIIHKAEKQLHYECIRNINSILATLDKQREDQYQKFKDNLNPNNQEHEQYLDRSRIFINRIKEHRHDKIKTKHIAKFKKLYFKRYGYHHNINRCTSSFDNIDRNSNAFSGQSNVPSRFSTRTTNYSPTLSIPATPMTPYLPSTQWIST